MYFYRQMSKIVNAQSINDVFLLASFVSDSFLNTNDWVASVPFSFERIL